MERSRFVLPLSLLLVLVIAFGGVLGAAPRAQAQASDWYPRDVSSDSLRPPESRGWVKADAIGGGCVQRGRRTDCNGAIVGSPPGLYEYPRNRRPAAGCEHIGCGPAEPGDYQVAVRRQQCIVDGVFLRWPAGTWHHGGYFDIGYQTRRVTYYDDATGRQMTRTESRPYWTGPNSQHRAFWHGDSCEPSEAWIATRTAVHSPPTATPPGFVPSPTPPGSSLPTVTPTPDIPQTQTATPSPCFPAPIPPMPLTVSEGTIPFDGRNFNPPFIPYAGRYIGALPDRYYRNDTHDAYVHQGQARAMYNQLPDRNLWVRVNANRIVDVNFGLTQTIFGPPGYPVTLGVFGQSNSALSRNLMIVLQDLGNDRRPGGGDDRLMAFIAAGDSHVNYDGRPPQRMRVWGSYTYNSSADPQIEGRPSGFQAYLHPGVRTDFTYRIFTWVGNDGAVPATRWPVPLGTMPARDWFWPPHPSTGERESDLMLRFATEPNRVYRMFAFVSAPVCTEGYTAVSQLVFHTLGDADMLIEKSAPAEAVREEQIGYSLTARNIGTTEAQNVIVTDALPEGTTFVSADPPPSSVDGRRLTWNLGNVAPGAARSISLVVNVLASAPDTLTNVGEVRADNDSNLTNNRSEATTSLVRTNVAVRMTATRIVRPGEDFEVRITYRNTSGTTARNARLTYNRPFGGVLVSSSRAPSSSDATGMVWMLGDLAGGAEGTITLRLRALREDEAAALPAALEHVAVIAANQDADPRDNEARAVTALLVFPRPQGDLRMRIHSEFDRARLVYRTDGTAFAWPIGETLYFIPEVTLREPPTMMPPAYAARQRIVAWSFVESGPLRLNGAGCKARETPPAAETAHADLSRMQGCVYRYRADVGPTEIMAQGRLYWSAFAPESLAGATYGVWPLPPSPTTIRIQYAVLTELVETGLYDIDEDGRSDSVLDRRTDIVGGTFTVTLVAPRDAR